MTQATLPAVRKSSSAIVRKSNILARGSFVRESENATFSIWEKRLIAVVASKIRWDDENFKEYEIDVDELLGKGYGGNNLDELEKVVKRSMRRQLQIRNGKDWVIYTLFTKCAFHSGTGKLSVCFHPDLKPHYLQLRSNYVQYELDIFLSLPSIYSQGLFEFLKSWSNLPEITVTLAELHEVLAVPSSMQKDFAQFRIRVLEKAKIDIEKHANFNFLWEPIKSGRTVISIRFIFAKGRMNKLMEYISTQEIQKTQLKNNKNFNKYLACHKQHGDACVGGHQEEEICNICKNLRYTNNDIKR